MDISNRIREYLGPHGVKQVFIADKCGWSRQKTNTIVCGKRKITADELASICDALNLPYDYFYNRKAVSNPARPPSLKRRGRGKGGAAGTRKLKPFQPGKRRNGLRVLYAC